MAQHPSRIDLLELDIDLRLAEHPARGRRDQRMVSRRGRRLHAGRVREGVLRRAHRGRTGHPLCRSRLSRPGAHADRARRRLAANLPLVPTRSPARLVVALAVAGVLAVFLLYTAVAGHSTPTLRQPDPGEVGEALRRRHRRREAARRLSRHVRAAVPARRSARACIEAGRRRLPGCRTSAAVPGRTQRRL